MPFSKTETAIEEFEHLSSIYDLSASPIEGYLTQYMLIVLCADMQQAVYNCIIAYLDDELVSNSIKAYMRGSLTRLFRSVEKPEIARLLGYFGDATKTAFNQKLENLDAEMQLYSDIVKARHTVAHDNVDRENIEQRKTFREIKQALEVSKTIIAALEYALKTTVAT